MISHGRDNPELARTYDLVSDPQLEGGQRLFERLALEPGARVLDVGCGTGRLAEWLAGRVGPGVVGIDPLPDRIALARERAPGLRFEVGRAEDLAAFGDGSFDAVCYSAAFHWIEDQPRALGEAARVLRSGGRLGMTTLVGELRRQGTVARVVTSVLSRPPWRACALKPSNGPRRTTLTELVTMLQQARFDLIELHAVRRRRRHERGEDVLAFLESSTFGNFLSAVPEDLAPQLRAELVEAFEALRGPDGIQIDDHAVLLVAEKARPSAN